MKDYNEEYFHLLETGLNHYPMLKYGSDEVETSSELLDDFKLDVSSPRLLNFRDPMPRNPKLGDYHFLYEHAPVISGKLKRILENFDLRDVQFIPAIIRDKQNTKYYDY